MASLAAEYPTFQPPWALAIPIQLTFETKLADAQSLGVEVWETRGQFHEADVVRLRNMGRTPHLTG